MQLGSDPRYLPPLVLTPTGTEVFIRRRIAPCCFLPRLAFSPLLLCPYSVSARFVFSAPRGLGLDCACGSSSCPPLVLQQDRLYAMKSIHVNRLSKTMVAEFENEVCSVATQLFVCTHFMLLVIVLKRLVGMKLCVGSLVFFCVGPCLARVTKMPPGSKTLLTAYTW